MDCLSCSAVLAEPGRDRRLVVEAAEPGLEACEAAEPGREGGRARCCSEFAAWLTTGTLIFVLQIAGLHNVQQIGRAHV